MVLLKYLHLKSMNNHVYISKYHTIYRKLGKYLMHRTRDPIYYSSEY